MPFGAQCFCLHDFGQAMTGFSVIVSQDHIKVSGARLCPREFDVVCVGNDFDLGAATQAPCVFDYIYCGQE